MLAHKGTPYYFLAWAAFEFRDFERAVFYMDAAVSEDIRADPHNWQLRPASHFIFLRREETHQSAGTITRTAHAAIESTLSDFSRTFGMTLDTETLVDRFVRSSLLDPAHRSLVTSLFSFVLEFDERRAQLAVRSSNGG